LSNYRRRRISTLYHGHWTREFILIYHFHQSANTQEHSTQTVAIVFGRLRCNNMSEERTTNVNWTDHTRCSLRRFYLSIFISRYPRRDGRTLHYHIVLITISFLINVHYGRTTHTHATFTGTILLRNSLWQWLLDVWWGPCSSSVNTTRSNKMSRTNKRA
jgi:hypothetical protein